MRRHDLPELARRTLVVTACGAVCVFVGAWVLIQLGAPVVAFYGLVAAFTAAALKAILRPTFRYRPDADSTPAPPPRPHGR
jgi:uncharacterized membrane protein YfcA